MNTIFVCNLAWSITREDLLELFSQYGTVRYSRVATDINTQQSRGFGFVTMASASEATAAIEQLNGCEWAGRILRLQISTNTRSARNIPVEVQQ
jgi:RNA recognition motif-containing protein